MFNRISISFKPDPDLRDGITEFLVKHEGIFERIDEKKRILRDDEPARSVISGRAIYPEAGDQKIMLDAANLASFTEYVVIKSKEDRFCTCGNGRDLTSG